MALIKCPECNREISDKAASCPHCGFPAPAKPASSPGDSKAVATDLPGPEANDAMREPLWRQPISKLVPPPYATASSLAGDLRRGLAHPLLSLRQSILPSSGRDLVLEALKLPGDLADPYLRFSDLPKPVHTVVEPGANPYPYAERAGWLDVAMSRDPGNPTVYYEQARVLSQSGHPFIFICGYPFGDLDYKGKPHIVATIAKLDHAIQLNSRYAEALLFRGVVYAHLGENEIALRDMGEAIHLTQGGGFEIRAQEVCLRTRAEFYANVVRRPDKAVEDYTSLLPGFPMAFARCRSDLERRAYLYAEMGAYDKAISDLAEVIQQCPMDTWAWIHRGDACSAKSDFDEAVASYSRAVQIVNEKHGSLAQSQIDELHEKLADARRRQSQQAAKG